MSMKNDVVISVNNVKKDFHLPRHSSDSLKDSILHSLKKKDKGSDIHHALKGVSFDIKKGEFFGIVGRNGSGKSTLLKIISDIYQPTSGSVRHRGSLVSFIELGVGFRQQLTGRENIYLNAAMLGFSKTETDEMYNEIVQFAELEEFMEQKLKNYSSGMKVRLAFAVAIQARSDILILDEVLAVGDAAFQKKCYEYFKGLKKDVSKTIVFVSHNMGAVLEYCDRAMLIEDGRIAMEGDVEKVAEGYMNLFNKKKAERLKLSRKIKIQNLEVTRNIKKDIVLKVGLKADNTSVDDVRFGFRILNKRGRVLIGVNNMNAIQGNQTLQFEAREFKKLTFTFPDITGGGIYQIAATVRHDVDEEIYDELAEKVQLVGLRGDAYYPLVIPAKLDIEGTNG